MKRYDRDSYKMVGSVDGDYILFTDHEAAINLLTRVIKEQRKANEELNAECMRLDAIKTPTLSVEHAIDDEREKCAELCEQLIGIGHQSVNDAYKTSADAIRQRGRK